MKTMNSSQNRSIKPKQKMIKYHQIILRMKKIVLKTKCQKRVKKNLIKKCQNNQQKKWNNLKIIRNPKFHHRNSNKNRKCNNNNKINHNKNQNKTKVKKKKNKRQKARLFKKPSILMKQ